jgi:HEAT repeats
MKARPDLCREDQLIRHEKFRRSLRPVALCVLLWPPTSGLLLAQSRAAVSYVAQFKLEKQKFLLGEPIFCDFTLRNTSTQTLFFAYRFPARAANRDLPQEPNFLIKNAAGRPVMDPAPHPCGGAKGSVVYGSVTLPPGATQAERWLLNQWGRFTKPGKYTVLAKRRLGLSTVNPATSQVSTKPEAYAFARDHLTFEVAPSTPAERQAALAPYAKLLGNPDADGFAEAYLVATTLPRPAFLDRLSTLASAPAKEHRWDAARALEGMARLGTRAAWSAIFALVRDPKADEQMRAYAILLIGERADPAYLPAMIKMLATAPESLHDDIVRALGFFKSPRANQVLFDRLHSSRASDRVNAILGLRNLETKDAVPALLAMLDDPDDQVRQVANFALQSLTGQKFRLSGTPTTEETKRVAKQWHDWWLKHEATFVPVHAAACHDW